jgi:hypothetical protein
MAEQPEQAIYRITIKGQLDKSWAEWFENLDVINNDDGSTTLVGPIVDQPALHGILSKVRDLSLTLISLARVEPEKNNPHR